MSAPIGAKTGGELNALSQLKGLRVNVGTAGSGVPALMEKMFEVNRIATPASSSRRRSRSGW